MASIMVVDDEPSVRRFLTQFLASQGHDVRAAENGEQALTLAREGAPELVLLDIDMPGIDGLDTLRRLRREFPESAVVMVSGIDDEQRAILALEQGARDYVRKPLDLQHLQQVLLHQLALRS